MNRFRLMGCCMALVAVCCWCSPAWSQWDSLKKLGKKAAEGTAASKAKEKVTNSDKPAPTTDNSTANTAEPSGNGTAAAAPSGAGNAAAASGTQINGQPDLKAARIEFVSGERTVFYDDFSDMAEDEPPPHWRLRGGAVELRTGGNIRQMTMACPGSITLHSQSFSFPKNFTVEIEAAFGDEFGTEDFYAYPKDVDGSEAPVWEISVSGHSVTFKGPKDDTIGSYDIKPVASPGQPVKVALWVQDGRARGYVNGERVADVNQMFLPADLKPAEHFTLDERCDRAEDGYIGLRSIRVAESAPDFSAMITGSGKYVTHGIYFDTDSDHLKPESAAVIRMVARGLEKNPTLKLDIDGYTDAVGNDQHNRDLSQRRADAVKAVLVQQFAIDQARLSTKGLGPANPIASNDSADGRAQNRRVEFVKD